MSIGPARASEDHDVGSPADARPLPAPAAPPGPPDARRVRTAVVGLTVLVAVLNFWTMPRFFYRGDAYAIKAAATNLVKYGELGIPESRRGEILGLHPSLYEHDQYLIYNQERGRYYSRWGIMATLTSAVPVAMHVLVGESEDLTRQRAEMVFCHNLLNVGLSCVLAVLLLRIALLYTASPALAVLYVLACFYATFQWYYLRAQSYELLQSVLFSAWFLYLAKYLRGNDRDARTQLLNSQICLGLLVLTKLSFGFLFGVSLAAAWVQSAGGRRQFRDAGRWLLDNRRLVLLYFIFPGLITGAIVMGLNGYQYGSPLRLGLGVPLPHKTQAPFSPQYYPQALWAYLANPQWSVFFNFPLLVFALAGMRRFWTERRAEAVALLLALLGTFAIVGAFKSFLGEWCYGPRFFLFLLPCLCVPVLYTVDKPWPRRPWQVPARTLCAAALAAVLATSCWLQVQVNAFEFFAKYEELDTYCTLHARLHGTREIPAWVQRYFAWRPCGLIARDHLIAIREGKTFPALESLSGTVECQGEVMPTQFAYFRELRPELIPNYRFASATRVFYRPPDAGR